MNTERAAAERFRGVLALDALSAREWEAPEGERMLMLPAANLAKAAALLLSDGGRLVAVFAAEIPERAVHVHVALRGELVRLLGELGSGRSYPSLAAISPAAALPERELHDAHGIVPIGHPHLEPVLDPTADDPARAVTGAETFVIPYGPIRSGVFEAIQYPIDTGGEDVLALTPRPFFKRRDLEHRMCGLSVDAGAYLAERIAGPAAVAHALAFSHAVERAARIEPPRLAQRWRVVHAELERIANHLDVAVKLAEDAALSVAAARFGVLKEDVMRLRARLCGSRFGRGVVMPGGLRAGPLLAADDVIASIRGFERDLARDRRLLLRTTSFTDRLIGSGTLDAGTVDRYGGVGPVARACALGIDARFERPYGAYRRLGFRIASAAEGDAMARLDVRFDEIAQSLHLIRQALERLERLPRDLASQVGPATGDACGWAEAPVGEVVHRLALADGMVQEADVVSPSLRNLPLLAACFRGDVLTDVSFIEHSFGLTPAGADR